MTTPESPRRIDQDRALRLILEGTVTETGSAFFRALVRNVAQSLNTNGAWVTEYLPERRTLRALAFWINGAFVDQYEYAIDNTPCQDVIEGRRLAHFPDRIVDLFPNDPELRPFDAVSFIGVPLFDTDGSVLGHLAAMDSKPMPAEPGLVPVFELFAARAAAEHRRLRTEQELQSREEALSRLLDSAMDAILVIDVDLFIQRANPAAERAFGCAAAELIGRNLGSHLDEAGRRQLDVFLRELDASNLTRPQLWIPHDLEMRQADGTPFPAEATLSRFASGGVMYFTLILRDIRGRIEAERRIRELSQETEYLRDVVRELPDSGQILGRSAGMIELLESIGRVAGTEATVLILGETGTGKELVARAIHNSSRRAARPMIRVNCAAVPTTLMESEFFGHEKGAFTGASNRRDGRFALADGGTIFLDEIAEMPLDLQAKLLRVLQEGEFEPLGSTRTRRVDVRVIAATNRDLKEMVAKGEFREDLYYRLSVFPLLVPPLRDRGDDIAVLATSFMKRHAPRMGRRFRPLSDADIRLLRTYDWPGNVRELQNVIERAMILARSDLPELRRALPQVTAEPAASSPYQSSPVEGRTILTVQEMQNLERENIRRALEAAGGRIAGDDGAARLLDMPASTLASRIKALGVQRPPSRTRSSH